MERDRMAGRDISQAAFRKSTYSDGGQGCVEAAVLGSECLAPDSKDPDSPPLKFAPGPWTPFIKEIKQGECDLNWLG